MIFNLFISILLTTIFLMSYTLFIPYDKNNLINEPNLEMDMEENINKEFKIKLKEFDQKMQKMQNQAEKNFDPEFIKYKELIMQDILRRSEWTSSNLKFNYSNYDMSYFNNSKNSYSFLQISRNIPDTDNPKRFFNHSFETNINKLPTRGKVKQKPWSGSYWPMRNGLISARFPWNDKNTIGIWNSTQGKYTEKYNYTFSVNKYRQPKEHLEQLKYDPSNYEDYVNENYSPSEKYDLFLGDHSFTLTNWNKKEGDKYVKEYKGDLPTWFGICHGWAPAAYYHKKPVKPVNVTSADGRTRITFLPDDIKALASLHFANLNYKTNFVGAICKVYPPKKPIADNSTGLWMENMCHAINPGSLVIIMGNHVGIKRQNLVLDPLSDHEVWNQPIYSYYFRYYNLITEEFSSSLKKVKIPIEFIRGSSNNFFNFLSEQSDSRTTHVIGVYMNITYMYEISPVHELVAMNDYEKNDQFVGAIQLDKDDNIIGGEWKYNAHPNFIWHYDTRFPMQSCCDQGVKKFDGRIDRTVSYWAQQSSKKGQILKSVLDYLVEKSAVDEDNSEENIEGSIESSASNINVNNSLTYTSYDVSTTNITNNHTNNASATTSSSNINLNLPIPNNNISADSDNIPSDRDNLTNNENGESNDDMIEVIVNEISNDTGNYAENTMNLDRTSDPITNINDGNNNPVYNNNPSTIYTTGSDNIALTSSSSNRNVDDYPNEHITNLFNIPALFPTNANRNENINDYNNNSNNGRNNNRSTSTNRYNTNRSRLPVVREESRNRPDDDNNSNSNENRRSNRWRSPTIVENTSSNNRNNRRAVTNTYDPTGNSILSTIHSSTLITDNSDNNSNLNDLRGYSTPATRRRISSSSPLTSITPITSTSPTTTTSRTRRSNSSTTSVPNETLSRNPSVEPTVVRNTESSYTTGSRRPSTNWNSRTLPSTSSRTSTTNPNPGLTRRNTYNYERNYDAVTGIYPRTSTNTMTSLHSMSTGYDHLDNPLSIINSFSNSDLTFTRRRSNYNDNSPITSYTSNNNNDDQSTSEIGRSVSSYPRTTPATIRSSPRATESTYSLSSATPLYDSISGNNLNNLNPIANSNDNSLNMLTSSIPNLDINSLLTTNYRYDI